MGRGTRDMGLRAPLWPPFSPPKIEPCAIPAPRNRSQCPARQQLGNVRLRGSYRQQLNEVLGRSTGHGRRRPASRTLQSSGESGAARSPVKCAIARAGCDAHGSTAPSWRGSLGPNSTPSKNLRYVTATGATLCSRSAVAPMIIGTADACNWRGIQGGRS